MASVKTWGQRLIAGVASVLIAGTASAVSPSPSWAAGDDYPSPARDAADCSGQFGAYSWCVEMNGTPGFQSSEQFSRRLYGYRNCTDFVAWRAEQFGMNIAGRGHARDFDNNAPSKGFSVSSTPKANTIAQTDNGSFGHVAWVTAVSADGNSVYIEDYNGAGTGRYLGPRSVPISRYRYIDIGAAPSGPQSSGQASSLTGVTPSAKTHFEYFVGNDGALRVSHWTGSYWQTDNLGQGALSGTSPSAYLG